ncbi:MAG: SpoIVB peptidase [Clostridiales bacterium]|nr:SpoIVB peptidase [Clostridiales bacterium]
MGRKPGRWKRLTGWIISLMMVGSFYTPQAEALRQLPQQMVIAAGQEAALELPFPLTARRTEPDRTAASDIGEKLSGTGGEETTLTVSLFGLLPLKKVNVDIREDLRLYPGGMAVGVALKTQGVLVVGTSDLTNAYSPARLAGVKAGDIITEVNGKPVTSTGELTELVSRQGSKALLLTVQRGQNQLQLTLEPQKDGATGSYRIGAWVRDSTAGVGTMSFYGEVEEGQGIRYGALGHAITDADTQQVLTVSDGEVMKAEVVDVRKGQAGLPGELKGSFLQEHAVMGNIRLNNQYGIYGVLQDVPEHPLYPEGLPIGRKDAVHTGKATILCTVDTSGMKEYEIEIVEVARQSEPAQRSMILRVTDERLLQKTGGIVQGMSGSPILQDGRIIGAVTHVFVNDPTMGYGLFVEWMIGESGKI